MKSEENKSKIALGSGLKTTGQKETTSAVEGFVTMREDPKVIHDIGLGMPRTRSTVGAREDSCPCGGISEAPGKLPDSQRLQLFFLFLFIFFFLFFIFF